MVKKASPCELSGTWDEKENQKELAQIMGYRASSNIEDRITGILMDTEFGSVGFWEVYARTKAKAIVADLEAFNRVPQDQA